MRHSCPTARTAARPIPEGMTIFCLVSFTTGAVRSAMTATAGFLVKTGNHDHTEIRDIWHPGAGLAGTRDIMAQIRDIIWDGWQP